MRYKHNLFVMTMRHENNYAFIDSQNLHKGVKGLGWKLDFQKFRVYLTHKYHVSKAFLFIGYLPLKTVISPHYRTCSVLLKRAAKEKIMFVDTLRHKLS